MELTTARPELENFQPDFEQIERNRERGGKPNTEPCLVCGRDVKDVLKHQVHFATDGTLFPVDEDNENHPDTQGWFPVGPECAKKLPAGYVTGIKR